MSAATILLNDLSVKKLFLHFLIFANLISFKLSHTLKKKTNKQENYHLYVICLLPVAEKEFTNTLTSTSQIVPSDVHPAKTQIILHIYSLISLWWLLFYEGSDVLSSRQWRHP